MNNFQPLPPHEGELYVELLIGGYMKYSPWRGAAVFPARVDQETRGDWARPTFRREVAEQIAAWYAELVPEDPVSVDSWRFDERSPAHWRTMAGVSRVELRPDENGFYPLGGGMWPWFLSAPSTPEPDAALLADRQRLVPQPGEAMVTIGIDGDDPHLPALIADWRWNGAAIPRFRREVAEVVAAWTNDVYRKYPDGSERAYWAGEDIVLLESTLEGGQSRYAERVGPDDDHRYAIGASRWTWELVAEH